MLDGVMEDVTDGVCDGVCDGVWLFGKDSFEECPLTRSSQIHSLPAYYWGPFCILKNDNIARGLDI